MTSELRKLRPAILDPASMEKHQLWQLLDSAASGVWLMRADLGELFWSRKLAQTFGYDLDRDSDLPDLIEMTHPDDRARHQETVDRSMQSGKDYEIEVRMLDRAGKTLWLHAHGLWLRDGNGSPSTLLGFVRDVSDRAQAQLELRRSEARFRSFFDQAPAAVFIKDRDSRHLYGNRVAAEYAGASLERFLGATAFDLFTPAVAEALVAADRSVLQEGRPVSWTGDVQVPNGDVRQIWDVKFPLEDIPTGERLVGGFGVDVTELHEMKQRLAAAQRLESLGLLASGVAHDFNNLLFGISGNAELALDHADAESREQLKSILTATEHAASLCRQLLAVGGKVSPAPDAVNACRVMKESRELFELTLQSHCRLRLKVPDELSLFRADEAQLRQILVNLLLNAKEASERNSEIEIGCFDADLTELHAADDPGLHSWLPADASEGVCIYVEDSGSGIEPELLGRIFEPYFTGSERGHGLGLAAVLGIVKGNAGALRVRSEPGRGTRFECYFPAAGKPASERQADEPQPAAQYAIGKAMVIDDHHLIVKITVAMLKRVGIETEAFTNSLEAVAALKERHREFDLVVSDVSMPDLGGQDVLKEVRRLDPALPVVFASGYAGQAVDFKDDYTWFVQKPWTIEDLERVLGEIGARRGRGGAGG